jgi:hypothetical protein
MHVNNWALLPDRRAAGGGCRTPCSGMVCFPCCAIAVRNDRWLAVDCANVGSYQCWTAELYMFEQME